MGLSSACGPRPAPRVPTGTSPPGCARAGAGTGWSRAPGGWRDGRHAVSVSRDDVQDIAALAGSFRRRPPVPMQSADGDGRRHPCTRRGRVPRTRTGAASAGSAATGSASLGPVRRCGRRARARSTRRTDQPRARRPRSRRRHGDRDRPARSATAPTRIRVLGVTGATGPRPGGRRARRGACGVVSPEPNAESLARRSFRRALAGELVLPAIHLSNLVDRLRDGRDASAACRLDFLTGREREILRALADGASTARDRRTARASAR